MLIRAASDFHGRLPAVEPCDVLVIAGDVVPHFARPVGNEADCAGQAIWLDTTFRRWLDAVPAEHVVATWGNHDWVGELQPDWVPADLRWTLLVDAGATVAGMRFWGSPWSPYFNRWAFNGPRDDPDEAFLRERWSRVPPDVDVMIVHGPPRGFGDLTSRGVRAGSVTLAERIAMVRPRLSLHGHIHEGRGRWDAGPTTIANVTVLDEAYRLAHPPMAFEW